MHIYSITLNAQGAGGDPADALKHARTRLLRAAQKLSNGETADDPGVSFEQRDPGGGPCAPQKYSVDIIIDADVLPEAQPDND